LREPILERLGGAEVRADDHASDTHPLALASPPGEGGTAMADGNGMEQAIERRRALEADIALGQLELWIGVGRNLSWPWIDVAVRVGKGWGAPLLDVNGPLVKRPDFVSFVPALRDFAEGRRDDALLASLGGSMRVTLRRSEPGWLYGEAWFQRGPNSQTVSFGLWEGVLAAAAEGAEAALERVKSARELGWVPEPDRLTLFPSATDPAEPEAPRRFEPWSSDARGEDVRFDYVVDGYGWYSIEIRVGDRRGGFGGGYLTDPMGDLLRSALLLLAGGGRAELMCNSEPGLTRVEFVREPVRLDVEESGMPEPQVYGCRIRIRDADRPAGEEAEYDALARSPRAVAEAIYAMALAHFKDGAGPWSDPMAALEGALATLPRKPDD
jgi:hypothetical protein